MVKISDYNKIIENKRKRKAASINDFMDCSLCKENKSKNRINDIWCDDCYILLHYDNTPLSFIIGDRLAHCPSCEKKYKVKF
jgi:hypothetical protein